MLLRSDSEADELEVDRQRAGELLAGLWQDPRRRSGDAATTDLLTRILPAQLRTGLEMPSNRCCVMHDSLCAGRELGRAAQADIVSAISGLLRAIN
jgi:hypothetical protein